MPNKAAMPKNKNRRELSLNEKFLNLKENMGISDTNKAESPNANIASR